MAANTVQILIKSKNQTGPGNAAAVASAATTAGTIQGIWEKHGDAINKKLSTLGSNTAKGAGILGIGTAALAAAAPLGALGVAMGAFGAVAIPTLKNVLKISGDNSKAQDQYKLSIDRAKAAYEKQMSVAERQLSQAKTAQQRQAALNKEHQAAVTLSQAEGLAQDKLALATKKLTGPQQQLADQARQLNQSWGQFQQKMAPVIATVGTAVLKLANELMPLFQALATAGAAAIQAILKPLSALFNSTGFAVFIGQMSLFAKQAASLVGPALTQLISLLLKLFLNLMPSGIKILQILLPLFVQLVTDLVPVITMVAKAAAVVLDWLTKTKLLKPVLLGLIPVIMLLVGSTGIGAILIAIALLVAGIVELRNNWQKIWATVKAITLDVTSFITAKFRALPAPLQDAIRVIGAIWRLGWDSVRGEAHAIWDAISGLFRVFTDLLKGHWGKALADLRATGSRVWNDIRSTLNSIWRDLTNVFGRTLALLRSEASAAWNAIRSAAASAWNAIWNNTVARVRAGVNDVVGFIRSLPGKILGALGNAGNTLLGWGKGVIQGLLNGMTNIIGSVWTFIKGIPGKILNFLGIKSPPQWAIDAGKHIMDGIGIGLGKAKGIVGKATASIRSAVTGAGEGVTRWIPLIQQALRLEHLDPGLLRNVLVQMQSESGGNPRAINLWDANARRGDPSRGLMQVIGSTFQAYHVPGTSGDIYDPLANIAAALNYAKHVYGPSLMSHGMGIGSGHGYAAGGPASGWAWVGEHGRELVRLPTGSHVYSNADSTSGMGGGGGVVQLVVSGGGQSQVEQFMLWMIRNLVRIKGGGNVQRAFGTGS